MKTKKQGNWFKRNLTPAFFRLIALPAIAIGLIIISLISIIKFLF